MIYPIVVIGHQVLREVAGDIEKNYSGLEQLIDNMFETMYNAEGIGLAAPQIGKPLRIFVIDGSPLAEEEPGMKDFKRVFINAYITERSGDKKIMTEGCLSIPNIREDVNREYHIRMNWYDEKWNYHDEEFSGYMARVIQHEYDHLDGVLFTDRVSSLRKKLLRRKLNDIGKGKFDASYKTVLPGQKISNLFFQ